MTGVIASLIPLASIPLASIPLVLAWDFEPVYVVPLLGLTALYLALVYPLRARYWPTAMVSQRQTAYFLSGVGVIAIGLLSPLNFIAMEYLLTAHMVQHVLFSVVAAPLLLLGTPSWLIAPLFRSARAQRIGRWLTHPVVAFGLYNLNMWVWHAPPILDAIPPLGVYVGARFVDIGLVTVALLAALLVGPSLARSLMATVRGRADGRPSLRAMLPAAASFILLALLLVSALTVLTSASWAVPSQPHNPLHTVMDWLFLVTATLYWCPILNPAPQLRRIAPLFGMFYLFISTQPMMALGALMVFSAGPLFHLYATAPRIFGGTALGDQQLAGLIMWLVMDIPLFAGITILFFRWMSQHERDTGQLTPEEEVIWASQQADYQAEHQSRQARSGEMALQEPSASPE
jgi:cytochrome c oxidase assembly factor CtaG